MAINWYPGHMHKAVGEIKKRLAEIDIIIEVLDARIPYSSENPVIAQFAKGKKQIKLLNKSDLADAEITQQWLDFFNSDANTRALAVNSQQGNRAEELIALCHQLVPAHSSLKPVRALITGIPNVGKSTLINSMTGRKVAKTGNEPAITKAQQKIRLSDTLQLFDSPGILWNKFVNQNNAYRLAATGAIKDTAMSYDDVALYAVDFLLEAYPQLLKQRYQLEALPELGLEFLEQVGRQRGCLAARGLVDFNKIGKVILNELRAGTIGLISLETPQQAEQEKQETLLLIEQEKQEKAQRKAERLAKHKSR